MPKGSIRNPGTPATNKKRGVQKEANRSALYKTPEYKRRAALALNKLLDTANYLNDGTGKFGTIGPKKRAAMARDVRKDPGSRIKKTKAPVGKGGR